MVLNKENIKIVHLTSVHPRYDTRVYLKECSSLSDYGYNVKLVVADGKGDEFNNGVNIIDVGPSGNRIARFFKTTWRVYKKGLELDANLYHLHDPELAPIGLLLKLRKKTVVFDSHEDVAKQIRSKPYLGPLKRKIFSNVYSTFENLCFRFFDGIIGATPAITNKFQRINHNVKNINNYPILGELDDNNQSSQRSNVAYIGGISQIRGIECLVESLSLINPDIRLQLAGSFQSEHFRSKVIELSGWPSVDELGLVNRDEVKSVLSNSFCGVVTFLPVPNHIDAQPNKMFEYMSAGVPVIASDFPLWKEIVEGSKCGICVDPEKPEELAAAITKLYNRNDLVQEMGRNGFEAVTNKYNWSVEEQKMFDFYDQLLNEKAHA